MSVRSNTVILRELDLPSLAKLLLLAMADRGDKDGKNCCPSSFTLAKETGMARSSVNALLPMLIHSGFVKHTGKKHEKYKTVIYELHLDGDLKKKCARFAQESGKAHQKRINRPPKCPAAGHEVKTLRKDLSGGGSDRAARHHHLPAETTDDDDPLASSPQQTEDEQYNQRVDEFRKTALLKGKAKYKGRATEEFLTAALDIIDERACNTGTRIGSAKYFETALANFLEDPDEVTDLTDEIEYKRARRERFMPGFNEQEHSDTPDPELTQHVKDVNFAIAESERTGREADAILAEAKAARKAAAS